MIKIFLKRGKASLNRKLLVFLFFKVGTLFKEDENIFEILSLLLFKYFHKKFLYHISFYFQTDHKILRASSFIHQGDYDVITTTGSRFSQIAKWRNLRWSDTRWRFLEFLQLNPIKKLLLQLQVISKLVKMH